MNCSIDGCESAILARGWCSKHYQSWKKHGDPTAARPRAKAGVGCLNGSGYVVVGGKRQHILIAEKAMGKPLPPGAVVHHMDMNRSNNQPMNLVVCPDHAYHMLLHRRMRAMEACGNPNWHCCRVCKKYDAPENVVARGRKFAHRACENTYQRELYARKKD